MQRVVLGSREFTIEDVLSVSRGRAEVALSSNPEFRRHVQASVDFLERELRERHVVYGVTTGYGDSCSVVVPPELIEELPFQLVRFHGCGLGAPLSPAAATAVMVVRAVALARGFSGVRVVLLERICELINRRVVPVIPEEGSVGASGDLTPLSYLAAMILGEREAYFAGERRSTADLYEELGIEPFVLKPKESLAIMNGTSVMTALACFAFDRAEYLARLASRVTALAVAALGSNTSHFDARLHAHKPHPGQARVAAWIAADLSYPAHGMRGQHAKLQDRYSLRCAPHVIGVLVDALPWLRATIETELNSANDNPLIDGEVERVLHGGHFFGGHIAFAMDALKIAVANVADLLDRQLALLVDPATNNGLPANLAGATGARAAISHGLKAVQIAASAWTAEALKLTMPASVFSRSTECHNQDKVSMGTIAARDCLRILELTEQVAAAGLLAVCQSLGLRARSGESQRHDLSSDVRAMSAALLAQCPLVEADRPLDGALRALCAAIGAKEWQLYEEPSA